MALSETAELAVLLKLQDEMSGPLKTVNARIKDLQATSVSASTKGVGGITKATSTLEKGLGSLGGALGHAKHAIGEVLTGPLGFLGLTAGVITLGGALESSIGKAQDFGAEVSKLVKVTGLSAETVSGLAAALDHFGVGSDTALRSIALLEKNVGNLTATTKKANDFAKTYGLSLEDASGHVKDANTLILQTADYFNNKAIPAQTKAAALAKLYGRNWQQLIPFLAAGSKGIQKAAEEANQLGLTLTGDNLRSLAQLRDATRQWGDALGGLQLQIGLALVPELTKLAKAATQFVSANRGNIVKFFNDAAHAADSFANAVSPVVGFFGQVVDAANKLPDWLKKLLVTGFVVRGASKFLFGFDPIKFGLDKLFKGGIFSRGSPANPMFVKDVTGGLGGVPGEAGAAGGAAAFFGAAGVAAIGAAIIEGFHQAAKVAVTAVTPGSGQGFDIVTGGGNGQGPLGLWNNLVALPKILDVLQHGGNPLQGGLLGPNNGAPEPGNLLRLSRQANAIGAAAVGREVAAAIRTSFLRVLDASKMTAYLSELQKRLAGRKADERRAAPGSEAAKLIAAKIEAIKAKEDQVKIAINAMKGSLHPDIQAVQNRIALDGIRLRSLQQRLHIAQDAHDSARAAKLRARIDAVKHDQDVANGKLQRIANKKTTLTNNISIPVTTNVSVRDFRVSTDNKTRYSRTYAIAQ